METKNVKRSIEIDFSEYYNAGTGENLIEKISGQGITLSLKENTDLVTIKQPENFSFINLDTLVKLYEVLSNVELGYLFKLIPLTKTEYNIIFNHTIPHSNYTLQDYLKIKSNKTFHELIKKLVKEGILYQMKGNISGAIRVIYIMNPFLSNRRRTFNKDVTNIFKNFK